MVEFPDISWKDYELIDCGAGEKLERFGAYVLARPEPKALWDKSLPQSEWNRMAHTRFTPGAGFGKAGKEDSGTWDRLHKMEDQWWIKYKSLALRLGLTSFKHVGVFPEQAPNWEFIYRKCRELDHPRVLNLFAYTGAASLAARAGGADVTHLDSVRQVVTWARGNFERTSLSLAGGFGGYAPRAPGGSCEAAGDSSRRPAEAGFGGNAPRAPGGSCEAAGDNSRRPEEAGLPGPGGIHWVIEDAMKFAHREARRGKSYDGIILDPPAYGHGPDGEKWKLDECLFEMLRTVSAILAPGGFVVLNLYSNGYSAALGETLVRQAFGISAAQAGPSAVISSGELALQDCFGKVLPLSIVIRLETSKTK